MKHPIALRTGMLAGLAAAWLAAAVSARADVITFDVSATMLPVMGGGADASCAASGCTLGGNIVINNTTGAVISEDVTFIGSSLPSNRTLGPFTQNIAVGDNDPFTVLVISDSNGDILDLNVLNSDDEASLVGFTGGALGYETSVTASELTTGSTGTATWIIQTAAIGIPGEGSVLGVGSLTPVAVDESDHELAPVLLLASGLAAAFRERLLSN
jgi:hypothetical protein